MGQPVFAVFKDEQKERDYPGFGQACAVWVEDRAGRKVVKLDDSGNIIEEFSPEECEAEAHVFKNSSTEQAEKPMIRTPDALEAEERNVRPPRKAAVSICFRQARPSYRSDGLLRSSNEIQPRT